ncbi:RNA-binding motif protein, X-linked 2-like [Branchiostoma floridae]|uniref:RNA-binding motif protein, X-linked 2-like n=1 Tax=Branchiostoma floridae TaxID=7739 RepID=C3XUX9_BRAFL|nr:RNA-binding motif protein, X-linked 2-like [Branchiostoma floridae]|eukprot:XP_002612195.1 hypothetical protein BRAFLDRAFT_125379 [Branchiostoma floridae]
MSGYMYNVNAIKKLSDQELSSGSGKSWHDQYSDSAWVFVGGLPYELTEGDVLCVFSQYGEIVNINMVRDKKTGKPKGFAFICYENQKSTVLAVDNFNGVKIKGRTIRVDHVSNYRVPKEHEEDDDITKKIRQEGVAPRTPSPSASEEEYEIPTKKAKKEKKKKEKKKKKDKDKERGASRSARESASPPVRVKKEKDDPGYKAAEQGRHDARLADARGTRGERSEGVKQERDDYREKDRQNRGGGYREERRSEIDSSTTTGRDARDNRREKYSQDSRDGAPSRRDGREAQDRQDYKGQRYDHQDSRRDRDKKDSREGRDDYNYHREKDRNERGWEIRGTVGQNRKERDGNSYQDSSSSSRERHSDRSTSNDKESKATAYSDPWDRGGRDKERGRDRDRKERESHEERKKSRDKGYRDRR